MTKVNIVVRKPKKKPGDAAKKLINKLQSTPEHSDSKQGLDIMDQYAALVKKVLERKTAGVTDNNPLISSMLDMTRSGVMGDTPEALLSCQIIGVLAKVLLSEKENKQQVLEKMLRAMMNTAAGQS